MKTYKHLFWLLWTFLTVTIIIEFIAHKLIDQYMFTVN